MAELKTVGRFAPTPSGRMHLGNVFAALIAWLSVRSKGGEMVLRMEDLDTQRTSEEYAQILREDLRGCGHNALFEHLVDLVYRDLRFISEARSVLEDNVERDHIHIRMGLKVERHVAHTVC